MIEGITRTESHVKFWQFWEMVWGFGENCRATIVYPISWYDIAAVVLESFWESQYCVYEVIFVSIEIIRQSNDALSKRGDLFEFLKATVSVTIHGFPPTHSRHQD